MHPDSTDEEIHESSVIVQSTSYMHSPLCFIYCALCSDDGIALLALIVISFVVLVTKTV
jgi:hypothetical protein